MPSNDRFKYAEIRQKIVDMMKDDLMGPLEPEEVLTDNPRNAYLVGILAPNEPEKAKADMQEQEIDADQAYGEGEDYTAGEDDDNEPITVTHFTLPSSIGMSFYVESTLKTFDLDVSWGDYSKSSEKVLGKGDKEYTQNYFTRLPMKETLVIDLASIDKSADYQLHIDSQVSIHISKISIKTGYTLVTAYIVNNRKNSESELESLMFQVELKAYSADGKDIIVAEDMCRQVLAPDEFYFKQRPIMGRGRGCATTWGDVHDGKTNYVKSDFIPQYEFPSVSAALEGFDKYFFSMITMSVKSKKDVIIEKLSTLTDLYEKWINEKLISDPKMIDADFREEIGKEIIVKCQKALERMRAGIDLLIRDDIAFDAFCFMNRAMIMQNSIKNYSKKYGSGIECNFGDFADLSKKSNDFGWYPFQIAFILMNLVGMVDPEHEDREVVDLLYFPTGGGKTEAYLGLMAFVIANRRLRASDSDKYNKDGGVTAILRYTLRLLTTQQRDRITKMVVAAELIRQKEYPKYGKEPITIGFWVGGGVTPNSFKDLQENEDYPQLARHNRNLIHKQLINCPFCGKKLGAKQEDADKCFNIDIEKHSVDIYCLDPNCIFYKYRDNNPKKIPVYLVDEEIYAKCPTIILSTVDKFARLPWDVKTNALFGRVNRQCSRHGYVALGAKHENRHNSKGSLPAADVVDVRPFLPPELIIQDELHLISGPLGTVYGAYETVIEDMCSYDSDGKKIKPKYVVSTATIKNAPEQTKCLYGRNRTSQFPPNGFEIGDSFFIREIPIETNPFRKYVGVCAQGQSVKTALLRIYAIILETAYDYSLQDEWQDVIDPYYTLVGYYNSIRELGGAKRLLQDDIPKRISFLQKRYEMQKVRYLNDGSNVEITSRMSSSQIPEQLKKLETDYTDKKNCLDTAIATNMIAVGMDVDRLGLMVVTGQPKQNSEYIQATSRIGRTYPGLVVTLYNPYRPRDLSHYENFTGYHSQLYRFVEGTTATPFSARARDRVLHALIISAIRLKYPEFAENSSAGDIGALTDDQLNEVKSLILNRLNIIKPSAKSEASKEIDEFIDKWKLLAAQEKKLTYYVPSTDKCNRLMNYYGEFVSDDEKATMNSMREVENASNMYYYTEE